MITKEKNRYSKMLKGLLAAVLLCAGMTGCGSAKSDMTASDSYENAAYVDESAEYDESMADDSLQAAGETNALADSDYGLEGSSEGSGGNPSANNAAGVKKQGNTQSDGKQDNKKIIKRYHYSYETEKFDEALAYLKQQIDAYDGYISSSEVQGSDKRSLYLTARIPAEHSDQFVGQLGSLGTMVSQSESAEDITLQYTDTESRIASLKTEQERLLALLDKADSLESIVTLEDRLTEVRYELENYESQRKLFDDLVSYSTVDITLEEVTYTVEMDDSTFFTRIKTGLEKSFRDIRNGFTNFVVWLIVALPYLVVWAFIIFVMVWVLRRMIRRHKRKKQEKEDLTRQNVILSTKDEKAEKPVLNDEDEKKETP